MKFLGLEIRALGDAPAPTGTGVTPPARQPGADLSVRQTVTTPDVYRAIQIITTAGEQLTLDVIRGGAIVDPTPSLIARPALDADQSEWIGQAILSLVVSGRLYVRTTRGAAGEVVEARVCNPWQTVPLYEGTPARLIGWNIDGVTVRDPLAIAARHLMRLPGATLGIGPIEAARRGVALSYDMAASMSQWFSPTGAATGLPSGVLTSEQVLTPADAAIARNRWNGLTDDGSAIAATTDNPSRVKVLGKGLRFEPILLSPADALWLDAQSFSTTQIARLFGVPASLMLAAVEGSSRTYANVEQEWTAFVRFTLMAYLRKIENLLTELTPRGQVVRFNLEGLLRSDTLTRFQAYALGWGRWLDGDDIRGIEHLPAKTITPDPGALAPIHQEAQQ